MKIYVIDDREEIARFVVAVLQANNFDAVASVTTVGITPAAHDLVIMDVDRPGDPDLINPNKCRVIRMSADPGNHPELQKPFRTKAILDAIRSVAKAA